MNPSEKLLVSWMIGAVIALGFYFRWRVGVEGEVAFRLLNDTGETLRVRHIVKSSGEPYVCVTRSGEFKPGDSIRFEDVYVRYPDGISAKVTVPAWDSLFPIDPRKTFSLKEIQWYGLKDPETISPCCSGEASCP